MALKMILNKQTDFTGEFPADYAASGLWRFNESAPDEDTALADSSGYGRNFTVVNWSGTTANLRQTVRKADRFVLISIIRLQRKLTCR